MITPQEIRAYLDAYVVGQERGKELLAVLLSMHTSWEPAAQEPSPNAFILGPTGSGKTYSLKRCAEFLNLPFVAVDSTSLVPAGIYGTQIEDVLDRLAHVALDIVRHRGADRPTEAATEDEGGPRTSQQDQHPSIVRKWIEDPKHVFNERDEIAAAIALAEAGIVFLDEFDKLATTPDSTLGERTQRRLLKAVEGETVSLGASSNTSTRSQFAGRTLNTRGILWIAGGAFQNIREPLVRGKRPASVDRKLKDPDRVLSLDIVNYGILTELVGRFPVLIEYDNLVKDQLLGILAKESSSPLSLWQYYYQRLGINLEVPAETREAAATRALELSMGARGLHQVLFGPLARLTSSVGPNSPSIVILEPVMLD